MKDITVIILTKNEESNIERAVNSGKKIGLVLVVDSDSTDRTLELAKMSGAKTVVEPWKGFASQRNWAIDQVETNWIFFLDADEEITSELAAKIRELDFSVDGYLIKRKSLFLGRWMEHGAWGRDYVTRLFDKNKGRVNDRLVHEEVKIDGTVATIEEPIMHYTQDDFKTVSQKLSDYVPLMAAEIAKKGRNPSMIEILARAKISFFRDYFIRAGFLDGWQGIALATWGAVSVFAKYSEAKRLMEHQK